MKRSIARTTTGRLRSDHPTIAERSATSLLLFLQTALQDHALEREDAVDDHVLPFAQPGDDLHQTVRVVAQRHLVQLEVAVGLTHEDDRLVADLGNGGPSHHDGGGLAALLAGSDERVAKEPDAQEPTFVRQAEAAGQSARARVAHPP